MASSLGAKPTGGGLAEKPRKRDDDHPFCLAIQEDESRPEAYQGQSGPSLQNVEPLTEFV